MAATKHGEPSYFTFSLLEKVFVPTKIDFSFEPCQPTTDNAAEHLLSCCVGFNSCCVVAKEFSCLVCTAHVKASGNCAAKLGANDWQWLEEFWEKHSSGSVLSGLKFDDWHWLEEFWEKHSSGSVPSGLKFDDWHWVVDFWEVCDIIALVPVELKAGCATLGMLLYTVLSLQHSHAGEE